ncbi:phage baseplate assembly protein V [Longimicrobium terrae]|uniref:Uncharacterized protein involved in type VI secretion and phage assembly n=1 Tax=Longimicrobium terrae TaxID=1639882 RepID=A0A841H2V2_9BACT|nr:phage baseplate assembly protein V [Longimicrobium terrae]MBB4637822.1 uncharacterized protein involved in type VI secretion and phage assembly [Longimicrobium terrae]MBB6072323.1 uncharacterized protein involved in type VI secretion and phage assembly [Longimicrobium terrae]NNC31242.1 hypothetical protein [Longimicrobium terrae]
MSVTLRVEVGTHVLQGSRVERLEVMEAVGSPAACELVFFRDAGSLGELDALMSGGSSASGESGGAAEGGGEGAAPVPGFGVKLEDLLDAPVRAVISDGLTEHEIFRGELVSAREEHLAHAASRFVVSAKSLSHRWDRHRDTKYYPNHTLADVVRALGAKLGGDAPAGGTQLNYVQYDESAWSFLARLADEAGLLMLSSEDGVELRGGFKDTSHPLSWGVDLLSLTSHAAPVNAGMKGALYQPSEKRDHRFHGVRKAPETLGGAATLVSAVERGSTKAVGGGDPGVLAFTSRTPTLADAKAALQRESTRALGNAVWVEGQSTRPGLHAGERVEVGEGEHWRLPTTGTFGLVEVAHVWDGQQYANAFRATPFAAWRAAEAPSASRIPGVVTALVVMNEDPEKMGRVRVRYPWMDAGERSGWVRVASVYAGNGRGVGFLPEVGDEVVVGFEQGDTERPLVLGSLWNGGDKAGHAPGTKQIQTKAGNTIRLEEAGGAEAIEIYSAGGKCRVRLSNGEGGAPKLTIVSQGDLHLEAAGELRIECQKYTETIAKDAIRTIGGDDHTTVTKNFVLAAEGTVGIRAKGNAAVHAGANLETIAGGTLIQKGAIVQTQPGGANAKPATPARPPAKPSAQQARPKPAPAPPRTSGDAPTPGGPTRRPAPAAAKKHKVTWSKNDKYDPNVDPRVMETAQKIADKAGVDLQLSSGYRPGDSGNHGRRLAVDINAINGVDIGQGTTANPAARDLVKRVQDAARTIPEVRENYGPSGLYKAARTGAEQVLRKPGDMGAGTTAKKLLNLQLQHNNHVHISRQP